MSQEPRWLLCRRRRPDAAIRMYCFPHSGGSPGEYMQWSDALPEVELWGVQLPGRGSRLGEPMLTSMGELVNAIVSQVRFTPPYVLFGHSLGALVAYETALALRAADRPGPARLYLSGYRAPHLHQARPELPSAAGPELVAAIEDQHGPLPDEVKNIPEFMELVLPVLRADVIIVSAYRATPAPPLTCPLNVLGGREDRESGDLLTAWSGYTTAACETRIFAGDHFYFREHGDELLAYLSGSLRECAAGAVPGTSALGSAPALP